MPTKEGGGRETEKNESGSIPHDESPCHTLSLPCLLVRDAQQQPLDHEQFNDSIFVLYFFLPISLE